MTPTAILKAESYDVHPIRHGFTSKGIPMRKKGGKSILAYTFCEGETNYDSPLLSKLDEMKTKAKKPEHKKKYERTIEFIRNNQRKL
jgi:hypothetical protein